ncbi:endo-1,4-beta-xylanase [Mangrovibacterium lignilyticum]|uniref:endo-1,4-beta-xylanase n=1 Tax=Mangrovibacterium lignilyticum TaxID=2668052 RepID=UPI0013D6E177|nr:endo-1,4-beta-xylanase [Mangrovibacterium lignilyticum]
MKKMKYSSFLFALVVLLSGGCDGAKEKQHETLKDAFPGQFYIGTALNEWQITGKDTAAVKVVKEQFNAIVAENCMKSGEIQPEEGKFDFSLADPFVDFGEKNNLFTTGHCLIWHSQAPRWFFTDSLGNDVSRELLIQRMKTHIETVVGRYKGRIKGWDVVNEAIMEDGSFRNSKFYQIIGEDFIKLAFQFAHEADPDAELYYNDYNEWYPGKRDAIVQMVKNLKAEGIRIDAVGMQGHIGLDGPSLDDYEAAITAYASAGVNVLITELDLSILPSSKPGDLSADIATNFEYRKEINPYADGLVPQEKQDEWDARMVDFFKLFLKHADAISRVTLWGVSDRGSWKNDFPVRGRTDYPLLFDSDYQPKPVVAKIIELTKE